MRFTTLVFSFIVFINLGLLMGGAASAVSPYKFYHAKDKILSVAVAPNNTLIAVSTLDKNIYFVDLLNDNGVFKLSQEINYRALCITFTNNSKQLLVAGTDNQIHIIDVALNKEIKSLTTRHKQAIASIDISNDDKYILTGGYDGKLIVTDVFSEKNISEVQAHKGWINSVKFSHNNKYIATGGIDGEIKIWDVISMQVKQKLNTNNWVYNLTFSRANNELLVSTYSEKNKFNNISVWNLKYGLLKDVYKGHNVASFSAQYFNNESFVFSGGYDGALNIWSMYDLNTPYISMSLSDAWLNNILLTTDEKFLVVTSNSDNGEIWVYKTQDFQLKNNNDMAIDNIKQSVQKGIYEWLQKGETEKTIDYQNRVTAENREKEIQRLTKDAVNKEGITQFRRELYRGTLGDYDADHEVFPVYVRGFEPFYVNVPPNKVSVFKQDFDLYKYNKAEFGLSDNNQFFLTDITYAVADTVFSSRFDEMPYKPIMLALNIGGLDISIKPNFKNTSSFGTSYSTIVNPTSDVDLNIPQNKNKNKNAIAVVIGNRDYKYTDPVKYALNDAYTMKNYFINVFGLSEENVFYIENATKEDFEKYFGTSDNYQGKIYNLLAPNNQSDVYIYYSGHGAPSVKTNKAYFLPVQSDPNYIDLQGYALEILYKNLSMLSARSVSVITDACYSGNGIIKNISAVGIKINEEEINIPNSVVFNSGTKDQVANWYEEKQHGLFTYYFLRTLKDLVQNKTAITPNDIYSVVADKSNGVPAQARRNNREQTPDIKTDILDKTFLQFYP